LTNAHEAARPAPWAVGDAPAAYIEKMLAAIVGFEFTITRLTGKWKVSQNRIAADREGVVSGLRSSDDPASRAIADLVPKT
jgi:transcriptional regulator